MIQTALSTIEKDLSLFYDHKSYDLSLFYDNESYIDCCLELAQDKLSSYDTIAGIKNHEADINIYKNMDFLEKPKNISILDENCLTNSDYVRAYKCILEGRLFSEHAAAGEATRLGLGTKYLINIAEELSYEKIAKIMTRERDFAVLPEEVLKKAGCRPEKLLPLSLGTRHMLQFSFDIYKLAKTYGYDPKKVLLKQKMLVVLNEATIDRIIMEFMLNSFFGFKRENVLFMAQKKYHGINLVDGEFVYDKNAPERLHNHGQMVIQQTMDDQIFRVDKKGRRTYLTSWEFGETLKEMDDKISYNIDDMGYLTGSIDYESLAFALKKARDGCRMIMEVVSNDPENPQKGGMAAFDGLLGRNVMIEAFQLKGIKNHEIKYLNKNFNHYPEPYESWSILKEYGLNMPVSVKNGYLYFQPVQGDINFLVNTEFFRRKVLKPIKAWKSPATTPIAIKNMRLQDRQKGFKGYAEFFLDDKLFYPVLFSA
ncbi:MAG TPA: hypothetical protein VMW78_10465 [Anaerolineae bacterium]|nr:hypothetical protein [Anaerolineae bacterium]